MKFLGQFLLFGFVAVYQVYSITGYSNSILFPFDETIKSEEYQHKVHKRQVVQDSFRCENAYLAQSCTNGLSQELVNLALQCGDHEEAQFRVDSCQQNPMGVYCGAVYAGTQITEVTTICLISETSNCSTQCQNLLTNIREQLGCCINVIQNSTFSPPAFNSSLWSSCGIEPIPNDCISSSITTSTSVGPTCNETTYFMQNFISLTCSSRYVQPTLQALQALPNEDDCEVYIQGFRELCGVDKAGDYCLIRHPFDLSNPSLVYAFNNCTSNTTCSNDCRMALQNFESLTGCCINNVYNGTYIDLFGRARIPFLSYEFWTLCGLETPGTCETPFTSVSTSPGFISGATNIATVNIATRASTNTGTNNIATSTSTNTVTSTATNTAFNTGPTSDATNAAHGKLIITLLSILIAMYTC